MNIRYIGELLDHSGYGIAARINIALLIKMGHTVKCVPTGAKESQDTDWKMKLVLDNMADLDRDVAPDIVIAHVYPPESLVNYKVEGIPLVSYIAWETDMLPSNWVYYLNKYADHIITTCSEMQKVFKSSGIIKDVSILGPTVFKEDYETQEVSAAKFSDIEESKSFKFYSIFQWIERKDPEKLIQAFIQEFDNNENVLLVLKTYGVSYDRREFDRLVKIINGVAVGSGIPYPPAIRIIPHRLTDGEMHKLHDICNCYVTPHRGEGTGLGIVDAIMHEKPVITTPYGGPVDFTSDYNVRHLKYEMVPVQNDPHLYSYFNCYMNWANVDLKDLKKAMREAYNNRDTSTTTRRAKKDLLSVYDYAYNSILCDRILDDIHGIHRSYNTIEELSK
jgi:glycosyltransferase involved in cell wall biosynthesis